MPASFVEASPAGTSDVSVVGGLVFVGLGRSAKHADALTVDNHRSQSLGAHIRGYPKLSVRRAILDRHGIERRQRVLTTTQIDDEAILRLYQQRALPRPTARREQLGGVR
jgi:hypothetical protein